MRLNGLIIKFIIPILALFLYESCDNEFVETDKYSSVLAEGISSNKIVFWGHSAGRIVEPFLEDEINDFSSSFDFERCSVNGEKMLQIAARQGSIPAFFYGDNCNRIGNKYFIANDDHPLFSSFDGSVVTFSIINGVNPCTINNVPGNISRDKNVYYFEPNILDNFPLDSVNLIKTSAAIEFRYPFFSFFWCDQLVDRNNIETLLEKYRIMIEFVGNERYLIIGSIRGDSVSHKEVESLLSAEFNEHYFNARAYLVSEAAKDMSHLSDLDRTRVNMGCVPLKWMKDDVHLNNIGAKLLSKEVVRTLLINHIL